jgi:hypothetical protein
MLLFLAGTLFLISNNLGTVKIRYPDESGCKTGILGYNRIFDIQMTNHATYHKTGPDIAS